MFCHFVLLFCNIWFWVTHYGLQLWKKRHAKFYPLSSNFAELTPTFENVNLQKKKVRRFLKQHRVRNCVKELKISVSGVTIYDFFCFNIILTYFSPFQSISLVKRIEWIQWNKDCNLPGVLTFSAYRKSRTLPDVAPKLRRWDAVRKICRRYLWLANIRQVILSFRQNKIFFDQLIRNKCLFLIRYSSFVPSFVQFGKDRDFYSYIYIIYRD